MNYPVQNSNLCSHCNKAVSLVDPTAIPDPDPELEALNRKVHLVCCQTILQQQSGRIQERLKTLQDEQSTLTPQQTAQLNREIRRDFKTQDRILGRVNLIVATIKRDVSTAIGLIESQDFSEEALGKVLIIATNFNLMPIVVNLLKNEDCSEQDCGLALKSASKRNNIEMVKALLKSPISREDRIESLRIAIKGKSSLIIDELLTNGSLLPIDSVIESLSQGERAWLVQFGAMKNDVEMAAALLPHVTLSMAERGNSVILATRSGGESLVQTLLSNGPISEEDRVKAIRISQQRNCEPILDMLLENGHFSVDPLLDRFVFSQVEQGWLLKYAARKNYGAILATLLARGNFSIEDRAIATALASSRRDVAAVDALLESGNFPFGELLPHLPMNELRRGWLVKLAASRNYGAMVTALLANGNIQPSDRILAAQMAAARGYEAIVEELLANSSIFRGGQGLLSCSREVTRFD